jgi:N-methylhydantoinase A
LAGFDVEVVAVEVSATAVSGDIPKDPRPTHARDREKRGERPVYFGPETGFIATPVLTRRDLDAQPRRGPAVIEDYEGTTVVPPDANAWRDEFGNIVIELIGNQGQPS